MASTLVNHQCTGLERSDSLGVVVVEVFERNEVTQQPVEIAVEKQQFSERHVHSLCCGESLCIGCLGCRLSCFPIGNLLAHLEELLLRHTGFGCLFGYGSQTDLLQFLQFVICYVFFFFCLVCSYDIGLQRCSGYGLFLDGDGTQCSLYVCQCNNLLALGDDSLSYFQYVFVGNIV